MRECQMLASIISLFNISWHFWQTDVTDQPLSFLVQID